MMQPPDSDFPQRTLTATALPERSPTDAELQAFVGKRAPYYLNTWFPTDPRAQPISGEFNAIAFLGGVFWLAYRKMKLESVLFVGVFEVMQVAVVMLLLLVRLAFAGWLTSDGLFNTVAMAIPGVVWLMLVFVCGTYGNLWYQGFVYRSIAKSWHAEVAAPDELSVLSKWGGTSWLAVASVALLLAGIQCLLVQAFQFVMAVPVISGAGV